jgi:uncharacterized protein YukE
MKGLVVMGKKFKLSQSSVNSMISVYEDSAHDVLEALRAYQLSLEGILGTGWKGKAAEKFTAIIEEYEKTTQKLIVQICKYKMFMQNCSQKHSDLSEKGRRLGENDYDK